MKYTFKSVRNENLEKQLKDIIQKSQNSILRGIFCKMHYFKENAEEMCNHEMALSALKVDMVKTNKVRL